MSLMSKLTKSSGFLLSKGVKRFGGATKFIKTSGSAISTKGIRSLARISSGSKALRRGVKSSTRTISKNVGAVSKGIKKGAKNLPVKKTLFAGGTLFGGIKAFDYWKDVRAKTDDIRQSEMLNENRSKDIDNAERLFAITGDVPLGEDVDGTPFYSDEVVGQQKEESQSFMKYLVGAGLVGGAGYLYYKNKKKKSKK